MFCQQSTTNQPSSYTIVAVWRRCQFLAVISQGPAISSGVYGPIYARPYQELFNKVMSFVFRQCAEMAFGVRMLASGTSWESSRIREGHS